MIRKGYYCKYRGKIYRCATRDTTVLLRSPDVEDFERNGFEKILILDKTSFMMLESTSKLYQMKKLNGFAE